MKKIFPLCLLMALFFNFSMGQTGTLVPKVDKAVYFDISPPLQDMMKFPLQKYDGSWKDGVVKNYVDQKGESDLKAGSVPIPDPGLQNYFGPLFTDTTIMNFDGMGNASGYVPPDTHGDIGFNHYFQVVNCSYAIYNKSGAKIFGPFANSSVWAGMPNNSNDGDAIVLFDEQANRWIFSQFSLPNGSSTAPFYQMIAVSQTPDPTGSWYRWEYEFSSMPDYPKFGIWPDGYYMSTNNFSGGWVGNGVFAYDRSAMLAGNPEAQRISFNLSPGGDGFTSIMPSDCDGDFPVAGTPNYFSYIKTGSPQKLVIFEFHSDWSNPANATFGNKLNLDVNAFNTLGGYGSGIPQKGSPQKLETLSDRLMYRLQFRNFNGYSSMVLNHSVDAGSGIAGIRWYELRNSGTGWSIYQQSTYAPADNNCRWMGSIAQDTAGTISLGYSVSGTNTYPSIRYTGRFKNDPLNQMTINERKIVDGGGSQTGNWSGRSRWGDYSAMSVDPSSPTTFWYTTEYYAYTSSSTWQTRIASFTFGNVFSSAASVTPSLLCNNTSDSAQLECYAYGGSMTYSYSWSSIPSGFTSTLRNPKVHASQTTRYVVAVSDGTQTRHDTTEIRIIPALTASAGNDTIVCWYVAPIPVYGIAENYSKIAWGTSGDGTFSNSSSLVTEYYPGIHDKTSGAVDLKILALPIPPCTGNIMDTKHIVLDQCTGIPENSVADYKVIIQPNPAKENVVITLAGKTIHASTLTITNMAGIMKLTGQIAPSSGLVEKTLDLTNFAKGIYLVSWKTDSSVKSERLVVQ